MRHVDSMAAVFAAALFVTVPACKGSRGEAQLPPAKGQGAAPMPSLPEVTTSAASDESTTVTATEGRTTGTTFPRAEAQVGPNAGGVIAKIFVKEGDAVKKGQLLFRLDARDAALRVAQAQAAREAARVNLRALETEHQRTKSMFDEKAISQMQWDQMVARFDAARVGVQQADVAVNMAQKVRSDNVVRSPLDGVVTSKLKSEGEMATMMPPTVVLVIQDQSTLELRFRLPEKALAALKTGAPITAKFEALGVIRQAKVTRIQPSVDARTRTVEAVADLPNQDGALKSGLLASVDLTAVAGAR